MPSIHLGSKTINNKSEPYVIAEIGVNHEGNIDLAKKLIDLAKEGGADAAKFQTYKADKIASKNSPSYWDLSKEATRSQFELFKKYDLFGEKQYRELAEHCRKIGIEFLSTPFDLDAVDFLDPLMPFFKIASADLTNLPMLEKIASKKKPIVLSTGAATLSEVDMAVGFLRKHGVQQLALLHCILNYPTSPENAHLGFISGLQRSYPDCLIGYSDHVAPDVDMLTVVTAFLKGAVIIEKHFTHDKSLPGNDHYHAMDASDLKKFRNHVSTIMQLLGDSEVRTVLPSEEISRLNARRSLVVTRNLPEGHVLQAADLICKRPGTGISPVHIESVLGKTLSKNLNDDDVLQWQDLK